MAKKYVKAITERNFCNKFEENRWVIEFYPDRRLIHIVLKIHWKHVLGIRIPCSSHGVGSGSEYDSHFKSSNFLLQFACNSTNSKKIATYSPEYRIISIFDDSPPFHPDVGCFEVNLFLIHTKLRLLQQNDSTWMDSYLGKNSMLETVNKRPLWMHVLLSGKASTEVTAVNWSAGTILLRTGWEFTRNDTVSEYFNNQIKFYFSESLQNRSSKEECNRNTKMGISRKVLICR